MSIPKARLVPPGPTTDLLTKHNDGHNSFLTHIDRTPIKSKVQMFVAHLAINFLICCVLAWRFYNAFSQHGPWYLVSLGFFWTNDPRPLTFGEILWKTTLIAFDAILIQTLWPGIRNFYNNSLSLRVFYGFRETEVVFRKASDKAIAEFTKGKSRKEKEKETGPWTTQQYIDTLTPSVLTAMNLTLLRSNAGLSTSTAFWELEFLPIFAAYDAEKKKEIALKTWDISWWIFEDGQWSVVELGKTE